MLTDEEANRVLVVTVIAQMLLIAYMLLHPRINSFLATETTPSFADTVCYNRSSSTPVTPPGMRSDQLNLQIGTELCLLGVRYGALESPLNPHGRNYTPFYHHLFNPRRQNVHKLLEIGSSAPEGSEQPIMPSRKLGASGLMWRDYFPHARVFLLDSDTRNFFNDTRITCIKANQGDSDALIKSMREAQARDSHPSDLFDIMIDDGSHVLQHQLLTLATLWPYVKEGGIYIIEDIRGGIESWDRLKLLDLKLPGDSTITKELKAVRIHSDQVHFSGHRDSDAFLAYFKHYTNPPPH